MMLSPIVAVLTLALQSPVVKTVDRPNLAGGNDHYAGNRPPLAPSAFRKLPIGAIQPRGWLRKQLELEAEGFIGHLDQLSGFLKKEGSAWLSPSGEGERGWEEVPYWLKGFGDLGYVLGSDRIKKEARQWIEAAFASQDENGYFGPRSNLTASRGKPDVWPNMVMLYALRSYYEHTGDARVIQLMKRYFQWQLTIPDPDFLLSYWERHRGGDNLDSVFWLYNRTGEPWLLELASKLHRRTANWTGPLPDGHGVNFAQAFREPATFAQLSKDPGHLAAADRNYREMRRLYGQVPGGLYGADENVRKGYDDARQAAETCAMVEMMQSCEMLLAQTGDRTWAERCEDVAFNSLPASMTADLKALRYLTAPNMATSDGESHSPGIQNGGPMFLYDPRDHRCCQHNVSHGWPYLAEHLWMATQGNGLAAAFFAPSVVEAQVARGQKVRIEETTDYPFGESVSFRFLPATPMAFPLTLRLPSWCATPRLLLNGKALQLPAPLRSYLVVDRTWRRGDRLELRLPMRIKLTPYAAQKGAVSVSRGPLTYSLAIGERWVRAGGTDAWPARGVLPTTPWNYGIVPDVARIKLVRKEMPKDAQPFTLAAVPVELQAVVRQVPEWVLDRHGLVSTLQPSPALTNQPEKTVRLVPMGAARLRISVFPTVSTKPGAHRWAAPAQAKPSLPASASHVWPSDTVRALTDGLVPKSSADQTVPRFTWWDHKGGREWVQIDLPSPRSLSTVEVYWFDDRAIGGECRVPADWKLFAWVDNTWREVAATTNYGVLPDRFNRVLFAPVRTTKLRIEATLQDRFSAGILEWRIS